MHGAVIDETMTGSIVLYMQRGLEETAASAQISSSLLVGRSKTAFEAFSSFLEE